jgi:ABC-type polysaccharide/polyol phosphate transport system ATPase subunit
MTASVGIDLENVVVDYPLYSGRGRSLKSHVIKSVGGTIGHDSADRVVVRAVDGISISLRSGDRLAIIGGNGAGKSTLLRVFAGIAEPSSGIAMIRGRVSPLIEMSMGMDLEATGYENIIMRGVFLGMSYSESKAKIPEVEEFCELGEYLALPIRTYSTGMSVRLSFAISTSVNPDILVLDEVIAAGDAAFFDKAYARMVRLIESTAIVIIATHDMSVASKLCNRAIFLMNGQIKFDGPVDEAIRAYNETIPGHAEAVARR